MGIQGEQGFVKVVSGKKLVIVVFPLPPRKYMLPISLPPDLLPCPIPQLDQQAHSSTVLLSRF